MVSPAVLTRRLIRRLQKTDALGAGIWMLENIVVAEDELTIREINGMKLLEGLGLIVRVEGFTGAHWHIYLEMREGLFDWVQGEGRRLGIDPNLYVATRLDRALTTSVLRF